MDLIILNDGLYQLIPVTKQIMEGIVITAEVDCFDLCEIIRTKFTGYEDTLNLYIMKDVTGYFNGGICK
mgnify:CR=1 FL=1